MNWMSVLASDSKKVNLSQMLCRAVICNIIWINSWSKPFREAQTPRLSFLFSSYWCGLKIQYRSKLICRSNLPTSGNEFKTIPIYLYMISNLTGLGGPDTLSVSLKRFLCVLWTLNIRTGWKLQVFSLLKFSKTFDAKWSDKERLVILSKTESLLDLRLSHWNIENFLFKSNSCCIKMCKSSLQADNVVYIYVMLAIVGTA